MNPVIKDLLSLLVKIAVIAAAFVVLFTFVFGLIRYDEPSMAPAIKDGDLVVFYRLNSAGYLPQDLVVVDFEGERQARRVVATAGDMVDITEEGLMVNGSLQLEPDIFQDTERYVDGVDFPLTVPARHIFVLGDSRENATDSRIYGCVSNEDTLGKVMLLIRRKAF